MSTVTSYQRAMILVTGSSLLVPLIGLATAPILTHSLGIAGRGEAGAAMAPNLLIVGGATLGLPQALTYYLAKRPHLIRKALAWASVLTLALGGFTLAGIFFARDFLAGKDADVAHLILVGSWLALPALVVGLLRGAATGRQMWTAVAVERAINSALRLVLLGGLAWAGRLDVTNAVLVMCIAPLIAGLAYVGLAARPDEDTNAITQMTNLLPDLLRYGWRVWLGSVAVMLMARLSQLLVTPLSSVEQLGLLIVAITISDVPYIVTQTVREVAFGSNSYENNTHRLLATSRITTLIAFIGSLILGATLPLWLDVLFGAGFGAATVPTWLLLGSSCVAVPGLIAGAGLDSAGKPGLRSIALVGALLVNIAGLLTLTPAFGAVGAALAAFLSTLMSTGFMIISAARITGTPKRHFFLLQSSDMSQLRSAMRGLARHLRRGQLTP